MYFGDIFILETASDILSRFIGGTELFIVEVAGCAQRSFLHHRIAIVGVLHVDGNLHYSCGRLGNHW